MRAALLTSALFLAASVTAQAAETVTAATWEETQYNVAQVVEVQSLKGLPVSAQLTTVYRGGIAAPFGVLLSIWDPFPQEGSDFGTVKTFDLGNFSTTPKVLAKKLRKVDAKLSTLELTLKLSLPNQDQTKTAPVTVKVSAGI